MNRLTSSTPLLLALAGCGTFTLPAHADGSPSQKAERADGKVAASPWKSAPMAKHNGSGVRLDYAVPASLAPGRSDTVQLRFSGVSADDARVEWRGPAGASVSSTSLGAVTSMALPRGQVTTLLLDVTPAADGMAYLDVFTSQGGRTSAQQIPLKVGSGAVVLKRDGAAQTSPSGEKVISLPSTPK